MRYVFLQVLLLTPWALLPGETRHTPTPTEMVSLKTISAARLSPDGRFVAYQVKEANWKENTFVSQLWLMNVATGSSFQLTRGKKSVGQAEWSPDGRWLAFITERESSAIEPTDLDKPEKEGQETKEDVDHKDKKA